MGRDGVENDNSRRSNVLPFDAVSRRLRMALKKLESASALMSILINDEVIGERRPGTLELLYSVKGSLACAIEEARRHIAA